jgi:N-hydroxyarylamine O-acetyltransferase
VLTSSDLDAYLTRIGHVGSVDVSEETLKALHLGHVFHIPFENLDVHLGREIRLDAASLMAKLVRARRGGYCYEMNGLFALVLTVIGFDLDHLMARVLKDARGTPPLSHHVLLVRTGGCRWLADVGFGGDGLLLPLRLDSDHEDRQETEAFRLLKDETYGTVLQHRQGEKWMSLYGFTSEPHVPADYLHANYFHSHSPDSLFTQTRICTKPMPEGRITLVDWALKIRRGAERSTKRIGSLGEYLDLLRSHFGIEIDGPLDRLGTGTVLKAGES